MSLVCGIRIPPRLRTRWVSGDQKMGAHLGKMGKSIVSCVPWPCRPARSTAGRVVAALDDAGSIGRRTFAADVGAGLALGFVTVENFLPYELTRSIFCRLIHNDSLQFTRQLVSPHRADPTLPARHCHRMPYALQIHTLLRCSRAPVALRLRQLRRALEVLLQAGWRPSESTEPRVAGGRSMSSVRDDL